MAFIRIVTVLALFALLATTCQAHKGSLRSRRQVENEIPENENNAEDLVKAAAECNGTYGISCYDCNTRVICKPNSVVLIKCWSPVASHCVNGQCSITPSAECPA